MKNYKKISIGSVLQIVMCVAMQSAQAAGFEPVDLSEESIQSRSFEQVHLDDLVSACFSVIQDIGFHVVETESAPVVIVANTRGRGFYTLTVNVQPTTEDAGDYRVRLLLDSSPWYPGQPRGASTEADFYQDFFKHLDNTYFTERATQ
jgi:hypothetical protein